MSRKQIYFTAGPAELYPKFEEFLQLFVDQQLGSISHRSTQFKKIYQHTDEQLRQLLNIPADNAIMFTGSASEIWEKLIFSVVEFESFHLVNGSFSEKFFEYSQNLKKLAQKQSKPLSEGFSYNEISVPDYAEIICVTQNETSTGVQTREADIHKLKRSHANKLLAVDMVSSAPIPELDFSIIDTAFFSVQKSFGLPAGLGVWIANEKCLSKTLELKSKGLNIGAHHDLATLWKNAKNYQNPATPNVMGIYLLGKVAEDMNKIGIEKIRKDTEEKSKRIYSFFEKHPNFEVSVQKTEHRSKTVAVINCKKPSEEIIQKLKANDLIVGAGYGKNKDTQIRISNFVANSKEQIEILLKNLENI
jgi:phosphoserine aminotransferase